MTKYCVFKKAYLLTANYETLHFSQLTQLHSHVFQIKLIGQSRTSQVKTRRHY